MPSIDQITTFTLLSLAIIAAPGPSVLFAISRSLMLGRKAGIATVFGNAGGVCIQIILAAFGLGAIVQASSLVFNTVKFLGALYLIYLGIQAIRHRSQLATSLDTTSEFKPTKQILREAFMVGLTNPKTIVFFSAILPQFVNREAGHLPLQMLLLGAIFLFFGVLTDSIWALTAAKARDWFVNSPKRLARIGAVGGLAMIGIGLHLALSGRHD